LVTGCFLAILFSNPLPLGRHSNLFLLTLWHLDTLTLGLLRRTGGHFYIFKPNLLYYIPKSCVTRRSRLSRRDLKIFFPRVVPGTPCARVGKVSSKNNKNWYMRLVDFEVPNKIQPIVIQRAVIQMVPCTIMLWCSVRST